MDDDMVIISTLRRPLSPLDKTAHGYIYAYWVESSFGKVKIGHTKKTAQKRLDQWQSTCKHLPRMLYPIDPDRAIHIPHPNKVERAIHAELRSVRYREYSCRGCGRGHDEWFLVPQQAYAVKVIQKWIDWIRTSPYDLETGELRDHSEKTMRLLCERVPLPKLSPPRPPRLTKHEYNSRSPALRRSPRK